MKTHIQGARLINPSQGTDTLEDVFIAEGKIIAFGSPPEHFLADQIIKAQGLILCPGFTDLSVRLREPGCEYRATLESEMTAAVAGGITHLVCPPDTDPALDEPGLIEMLQLRARKLKKAYVYPLGALTVGLKGKIITEMAELSEAGCIGFSQAHAWIQDTQVLLHAMEYAASFGFTVWLNPQDGSLASSGVVANGPTALKLGLQGIPVAAETLALQKIFELMRLSGARVHLCRLTSAAGIALVKAAKQEGLPLTCDIGVHHLHLIDQDIGDFNAQYRLTPPLRQEGDRQAIHQGLLDGTIDAICSDHTPVDDDEKLRPFAEASPGATGLELLLPLVLKWAADKSIPLPIALSKITSGPAETLAASGYPIANLEIGSAADLCLFDPQKSWEVIPKNLYSQGHNSPYREKTLQGQVQATWINSRLVFQAHE